MRNREGIGLGGVMCELCVTLITSAEYNKKGAVPKLALVKALVNSYGVSSAMAEKSIEMALRCGVIEAVEPEWYRLKKRSE